MKIQSAKDLIVYQKAYALAMDIFHATKKFPSEERYALVSQIRRSSRSVCLNLREAWAKRRYESHFISKLTDCDAEMNETDTSLDFAKDCGFISAEDHVCLSKRGSEVRRMLGSMLTNAAPFLLRAPKRKRKTGLFSFACASGFDIRSKPEAQAKEFRTFFVLGALKKL